MANKGGCSCSPPAATGRSSSSSVAKPQQQQGTGASRRQGRWKAALLAFVAVASCRVACAAGDESWGTPAELKSAINADYRFARTNWDSALLNGTHPQ